MHRVGAVIPARGGSKGIPRKNLVEVGGTPLVSRAVRACRQAGTIHDVVVSTDDEEIAAVATATGARVVHRPPSLAGDAATSESAVAHVIDQLPHPWDIGLLVQCTSPFLQASDLDRLVSLVASGAFDSAFTAARTHRFRWTGGEDGAVTADGHDPGHRRPRQSLPPQFEETGAAYCFGVEPFLHHRSRFFGRTGVVEVPAIRAVEIDEHDDLVLAAALAPVLDGPPVLRRTPRAVVFDFDGVMTDNRAWLDQDGRESVAVSRADGLAVGQLRGRVELLVLSTERNPVVARRCEKLMIPCCHGVDDKRSALLGWLVERGVEPADCLYVGNDRNDLGCMAAVGTAVAPADAEREARDAADVVLRRSGGAGAVREVVDLVLEALTR